MNSPEIEAIFHDALGLLPADRGVFVAASAKGNASVIAEVQRLKALERDPRDILYLGALHAWFGNDADYLRLGESLINAAEPDGGIGICPTLMSDGRCVKSHG